MATHEVWFHGEQVVTDGLPAENTRKALGYHLVTLYDITEINAAGGGKQSCESCVELGKEQGYRAGYDKGYDDGLSSREPQNARSQNLVPEQRLHEVEYQRDDAIAECAELRARIEELELCITNSRDEADYVRENIDNIESNFADLKHALDDVSI